MKSTIKLLFVCIVIISSLMIVPQYPAYACSCLAPERPSIELVKSDAVFSGKVIEIKESGPNIFGGVSSGGPVKVLLEVDQSWKGVNQTQVIVETVKSSASCGFEFEINRNYIIYASKDEDGLKTGLCSRTSLLAHASNDLQELGTGSQPTEVVQISFSNKHPFLLDFAIIGGIIAIGAFTLMRIGKRQG